MFKTFINIFILSPQSPLLSTLNKVGCWGSNLILNLLWPENYIKLVQIFQYSMFLYFYMLSLFLLYLYISKFIFSIFLYFSVPSAFLYFIIQYSTPRYFHIPMSSVPLQSPLLSGLISMGRRHPSVRMTAGCSHVSALDSRACGAVVHVVEKMLVVPKVNVMDLLESNEDFSIFTKMLKVWLWVKGEGRSVVWESRGVKSGFFIYFFVIFLMFIFVVVINLFFMLFCCA